MIKVTITSGICGFSTNITAQSEDGQNVTIAYETTCPHIGKAKEELASVDAFAELFTKPANTTVYQTLSKYIPHVACPAYSGFLKAIEAAAGMALPKDAVITITRA